MGVAVSLPVVADRLSRSCARRHSNNGARAAGCRCPGGSRAGVAPIGFVSRGRSVRVESPSEAISERVAASRRDPRRLDSTRLDRDRDPRATPGRGSPCDHFGHVISGVKPPSWPAGFLLLAPRSSQAPDSVWARGARGASHGYRAGRSSGLCSATCQPRAVRRNRQQRLVQPSTLKCFFDDQMLVSGDHANGLDERLIIRLEREVLVFRPFSEITASVQLAASTSIPMDRSIGVSSRRRVSERPDTPACDVPAPPARASPSRGRADRTARAR